MRGIQRVVGLVVLGVAAVITAGTARGAGLLIADGGFGGVLEIKEHDVKVSLNNGIAVTKVTQVFHNTENRQVEALYTFPVPKGASVANFSMWINGKEMVGEVLEKERAREIYNSYKAKRQDPGLLEQVDYKRFEMRIFPIAADADQRVEVTYYQELDVDNDWFTYVYPLATATRSGIDTRTTGTFSISLDARSAVPLVNLESPSHSDAFVMARQGDDYWQASLEVQGGSLARDVVISGHLSRPHTGMDLLTSKPDGEDGYFLLTLTAGEDLGKQLGGMDYVFLMDISGSMGDDSKLALSKEQVGAFIHTLGEKDRFEIITFNVQPKTLFGSLSDATPAGKSSALAFLDSQAARGGTVLRSALQTAYKYADPDRPMNLIILSDGMTQQHERAELLALIGERPRSCRAFCIGVGNEVNRPLLEQLSSDTGGLAAFISRGDNFERQAKAFRRKLTRPVAADLTVAFNGVEVYDVEPRVLPNLYHGSPIRMYGRYRGAAEATVSVKGDIRGIAFKKRADMSFPKQDDSNPEIERSWASHRIDSLLKQADRSGKRDSVLSDIVRLGETYSIVTEYTSFLVLENDGEFRRWKIERRNAARMKRDRAAQSSRDALLAQLRDSAVADIGPTAPAKPSVVAAKPQAPRVAKQPTVRTTSQSRRNRRADFDMPGFGGGTGPIGPLFLIVGLWARRKRRMQK